MTGLIQRASWLIFGAAVGLSAQSALLPEVHEKGLPNGLRVLVVERPGDGVIHARLVAARMNPDPTAAPALAHDMIRRCLASPLDHIDRMADPRLETLIDRADGLGASLGGMPDKPLPSEASPTDLRRMYGAAMQDLCAALEAAQPEPFPGAAILASSIDGDALSWAQDLLPQDLEPWCRNLTARLHNPLLPAFPILREAWLRDLEARSPGARPWPEGYAMLLPIALGDAPYARGLDATPATVGALTWAQVRQLAAHILSPERLFLILVGDVKAGQVFPILDRTLGTLTDHPQPPTLVWPQSSTPPGESGARRMQIMIQGEPRVLTALRLPGETGSTRPFLDAFAMILRTRLEHRLTGQEAMASSVTVAADVPGGREAHLLVIEAEPAITRAVVELENAIRMILLQLCREGASDAELYSAKQRLEARESLMQDDATDLARSLGRAMVRAGDWRSAFPHTRPAPPLTREAFLARCRDLLHPDETTTVVLEQDLLANPQDPSEAALVPLLSRMLTRGGADPSIVPGLVRETLRHMRLLTPTERTRIRSILETHRP